MEEPVVSSCPVSRKRSKSKLKDVVLDDPTLAKLSWCNRQLLAWYVRNGRKFPWRSEDAGLYEKIVVEVLLQRTQASSVARIFDTFFQQFRNWDDIHTAPVTVLEETLRPIGLWRRRATALKDLASEMVHRAGRFPPNRNELEMLPAVGQYVANAVLLFAYNRPEPLLDANMARVIERVFEARRLIDIRYDPKLRALAFRLVSFQQAVQANWAVLDIAALICRPKRPLCSGCPLQHGCNYKLQRSLTNESTDG
jgi:A/G-specific adenine glycosylase